MTRFLKQESGFLLYKYGKQKFRKIGKCNQFLQTNFEIEINFHNLQEADGRIILYKANQDYQCLTKELLNTTKIVDKIGQLLQNIYEFNAHLEQSICSVMK